MHTIVFGHHGDLRPVLLEGIGPGGLASRLCPTGATLIYLPSQGPRIIQITHARKGEVVRHRCRHTRGDREPMPVCASVACGVHPSSGELVMLAERR
jgi:hypothetical protein